MAGNGCGAAADFNPVAPYHRQRPSARHSTRLPDEIWRLAAAGRPAVSWARTLSRKTLPSNRLAASIRRLNSDFGASFQGQGRHRATSRRELRGLVENSNRFTGLLFPNRF